MSIQQSGQVQPKQSSIPYHNHLGQNFTLKPKNSVYSAAYVQPNTFQESENTYHIAYTTQFTPLALQGLKECHLTEGFENVKNQIGFCGIWCGSCLGGNGAVLELTRKYEQIIKRSQHALEKWAPKEFNFNGFMKGLAYIQAMPLCPGCKKGGGDPTCTIRSCASKKDLTNCGQCDGLAECKSFESMEQGNPKIKEELRKIKNVDQKDVIEKWLSELKTKWPHCTLLCNSEST